MSFIPKGSLAFSGYGADPIKFLSPDGVDLGAPASAPICGGGGGSAYCNGILPFVNGGGYFAVATNLTPSGDIWDTQFVRVAGITPDARSSVAAAGGFGYSLEETSAPGPTLTFYLRQFNTQGLNTASWVVFGPGPIAAGRRDVLGVNADSTVAYVGESGSGTIYAYDMVGSTIVGTFATESGHALRNNAIHVLPNGEVLVEWEGFVDGDPIYAKRCSAAGATLATYTLPGAITGVTIAISNSITRGLDPRYSFWCSFGDSSAYGVGVAEVRIDDGAILHRFSPPNTGFQWDAPFCIVTDDIDAPVTGSPPDPKPAIPIVKCIPSKTIEASPKAAAGCNQGGVGFTIGDAAQKATVGLNKGGGERGVGRRGKNAVPKENRIPPPTLAEAGIDKKLSAGGTA